LRRLSELRIFEEYAGKEADRKFHCKCEYISLSHEGNKSLVEADARIRRMPLS
jgi:hypothetical protein